MALRSNAAYQNADQLQVFVDGRGIGWVSLFRHRRTAYLSADYADTEAEIGEAARRGEEEEVQGNRGTDALLEWLMRLFLGFLICFSPTFFIGNVPP